MHMVDIHSAPTYMMGREEERQDEADLEDYSVIGMRSARYMHGMLRWSGKFDGAGSSMNREREPDAEPK
ncbi:uncharacterized protein BO96DRAFT_439078 [Aspergillus niger CBS 101883]|uniref:uncharacterized protein n=1 Tax=Aspergillus lacticoffeatus (strain CBS 101883) TaxID=1450533 RepID=UPI000D7FD371|nr:uncharacterized protein BO96DRAFT_439078 [Aspergillus niger CBS 101883]PYH51287.1 hypothetical protein BO96DRAFT_439078 [Aspergillus niger CBS 101883]